MHHTIRFLWINTSAFIWAYLLYIFIGHIDIQKIIGVKFPFLNFIGFILVWILSCICIYLLLTMIATFIKNRFSIVQKYLEFIEDIELRKKYNN